MKQLELVWRFDMGYNKDEIKKILDDNGIFLKALEDGVEGCPSLKPTAIAKIMENYRTRLKDAFGIEEA